MAADRSVWPSAELRTRKGLPSAPVLLASLNERVRRLVRAELRLFKAAMLRRASLLRTGAVLLGAAAFLAFLVLATLTVAGLVGLTLVLPLWLSALIMIVVLLALAGLLVLVGMRTFRPAETAVVAESMGSRGADEAARPGGIP